MELAELCAAGKGSSSNTQQCWRRTDLSQRVALEKRFLLNSAKFMRKPEVLQVFAMQRQNPLSQ